MALPSHALAAVMTAPQADLQIREFPLAAAPEGGAIVRIACCTICRSDLHTWLGRRPGPTPAILGHEIVGTIAQLGDGLTHDVADRPLAVGDRITWTIHSACGRCYYCRDQHLPMKCRHLRKYGHGACEEPPHLQGGLAEYCVIDSGTSVLKLPDSLSDAVAAAANCAVATTAAGWEAAALQPCEQVLIQGAGALGCYAAAYAAHAGCRRVIVTDVDAKRLDFIRRFGATDCIDVGAVGDEETAVRIKELTGGHGADCAMEVAGVPAAIPGGLAALRRGGRYLELGCCFPAAMAAIDMSLVLGNLLTIRGVHNYDVRHLRRAVDFLEQTQGRFPYDEMIGQRYSLNDVNLALRAASAGAAMRVAVVP